MEVNEIKKIIEAILFANGDIVTINKLCEILSLEEKELKVIISDMIITRNDKQSGVLIKEINNGYQMSTNKEYYDYVRKLFERNTKKTLSQAAYETLSIIAYNKNTTRAKIESIRGVGAGSTVATLRDKGFIEEAGRLEAPGRPVYYKVTNEFLRAFDLKDTNDLLPIETFGEIKKEEEE